MVFVTLFLFWFLNDNRFLYKILRFWHDYGFFFTETMKALFVIFFPPFAWPKNLFEIKLPTKTRFIFLDFKSTWYHIFSCSKAVDFKMKYEN